MCKDCPDKCLFIMIMKRIGADFLFVFEIYWKKFCWNGKKSYLCIAKAQMAESVDALVSNTSGATHPGSIPGLGTKREFHDEILAFTF